MGFGTKCKALREAQGLSQEQMANELHVTRQALSKWERGVGMPDIENIKAIAIYFDVTLDSLLDDEEEVETKKEALCWNLAFGGFLFGMVLDLFLPVDFKLFDGMGGFVFGILGYGLGWMILQCKKIWKH